jgi:cysteinyl-tRNA synthetase
LKDNSTSSQGEGPLVTSGITSEGKRIKCDFVLWKGSKPGELVWKSPSGLGPHIECIVDANILLCENSFSQ